MLRFIFPLILIVGAGVIFFVWTDPLINAPKTINPATGEVLGGVLALRAEKAVLQTALADARALKTRISELEVKLNQISANQIARLDAFLPESIDGVQLVVDMNNIAARSGLTIDGVRLIETQTRDSLGAGTVPLTGESKAVPVTLTFTTTGSYGQIRSFISDLSRSLRILDLSSLSFEVSDNQPTKYNFNLTTYWIK